MHSGTLGQSTSAFRPGLGHDRGERSPAGCNAQPRRPPHRRREQLKSSTGSSEGRILFCHHKQRWHNNWSYWALCIRGTAAGSSSQTKLTVYISSTHTPTDVFTLHSVAGFTHKHSGKFILHAQCLWIDASLWLLVWWMPFFTAYHSPCSGPVQREQ